MQQKIKYHSKVFSLQSKNRTLHFCQPDNVSEIIDNLSDQQAKLDQYQPYWTQHWPSSETFFSFIINQPFPKPLRILEIGCGLGTLTAALTDKGNLVTAIDIAPDACQYSRFNARRNNISARFICCDMCWLPIRKPHFDLVVASDILYEERMHDMLLDTLAKLIDSHNKAWIADPCRRGWKSFQEKASDRGFVIRQIQTHDCINGMRIEIIELKI